MFESVARSASSSVEQPGPKNSMNFPTTPCCRSICVRVSTRSVAVVPAGSAPLIRTPTTMGHGRNIGWPSMAASASMPPTPHPSTPSPLIIVVWESVPTSVSGMATPSRTSTTRPRCSRFTWWQIPMPGGTTRNPSKPCWAHRRNEYRSPLRRYSHSTLARYASAEANMSTWTEWSMMRSTGTSGFTFAGSPPARSTAERIAAMSTAAGTPVKSCISTRAGMKARAVSGGGSAGHRARADTSSDDTSRLPARRRRFSSRIFTVWGRRARSAPSTESSRWMSSGSPPASSVARAPPSSAIAVTSPPRRPPFVPFLVRVRACTTSVALRRVSDPDGRGAGPRREGGRLPVEPPPEGGAPDTAGTDRPERWRANPCPASGAWGPRSGDASGRDRRPLHLDPDLRREPDRVVHRAVLDHPLQRLPLGRRQRRADRDRQRDGPDPSGTVLRHVEPAGHSEPVRRQPVSPQEPAGVEAGARGQAGDEQLRRRRPEIPAPISHRLVDPQLMAPDVDHEPVPELVPHVHVGSVRGPQ